MLQIQQRPVMKILLKILLALLAIPLVLVAAFHFLFDANSYKEEISARVEQATGRHLTLAGDINVSLFPWLGIEVREATLSQPPGFGTTPFARVYQAQARLKWLPLFQGRVELDEILGSGVVLNLIRAPDGRNNWDDLGGAAPGTRVAQPLVHQQEPDELESEEIRPPLPKARGHGLNLQGVHIRWEDQEDDSRLVLSDLGVTAEQLDPSIPVDIRIAGNLARQGLDQSGQVALQILARLPADRSTLETAPFTLEFDGLPLTKGAKAQGALSGTVRGDLRARTYAFGGLQLDLRLADGPFHNKALQLTSTGEMDLDNRAETLALRDLVLKAGSVRLEGAAKASQLYHEPRYEGQMALAAFDARGWLKEQGLPPPTSADPTALTRVGVKADWQWAAERLVLDGLDVLLDKSRITGTAAWLAGSPARLEFDLKADSLNLDAYLPPDQAPTPPPQPGAAIPATPHALAPASSPPLAAAAIPTASQAQALAQADEIPLLLRLLAAEVLAGSSATVAPAPPWINLDGLSALDLQGRLVVNQLVLRGLIFGDFDGRLQGQGGDLQLDERVGRFYSGQLRGKVRLDSRQTPVVVQVQQQGERINFGDLVRDLSGKAVLSGSGRIEANLSAQGLSRAEILPSLAGTASFDIPEGQLRGFDVERAIQQIEADIRGKPSSRQDVSARQTPFTDLRASANIDQGVIHTQDLQASSGYFRISGKGRIDLPQDLLDVDIEARVENAPADQTIKKIEGIPVPIHVGGSPRFPEWTIDPAPVIKELAKRRLEKELQRGGDNRLQKLEERTGIKGLEQGLKSLLGR